MKGFSFLKKGDIKKLPKEAGVYLFKGKKTFLYIGKAGNIQERVKTHLNQPNYRDNLFLKRIKDIGYIKTSSEIEALFLESKLIKKCQPRFNIIWKDDKNYFWVAISNDEHPRVFITHQTNNKDLNIGPFTDGQSLKKTLRFLRKAIPYYTTKKHSPAPCLWCHLQLCPGPNPDIKEYKKNINNLIRILRGEKTKVLKGLKKEMKMRSRNRDFEKAATIRDQVFALEIIISHAKVLEPVKTKQDNWNQTQGFLQGLLKTKNPINRIEGYDVSNIQGKQATASMVVFTAGFPDKNQYRKFKMKISGKPNDTAMIKEVLTRRMLHNEWPFPDLILIDGGKPQLSSALKVNLKNIKVVTLAKKKNELYIKGKKKPILLKTLPREIFNLILQIRDESHRFALAYHKKLREKGVLNIS